MKQTSLADENVVVTNAGNLNNLLDFTATMELKEPKSKSGKKDVGNYEELVGKARIKGKFNGFSVVLENTKEAQKLINCGAFGKGSLSRGFPVFDKNQEIIRKRQFVNRKNWSEKFSKSANIRKVIVIPDSSDSESDYFNDLKPEYQVDFSKLQETINLSLPEAFFLLKYIKCLDIFYQEELLDEDICWEVFSNAHKHFLQDYVCYHHFKCKNWVVKTGIKFGGDFLLYKEGPASYHASYVVIIDVLDGKSKKRRLDLCRRNMDPANLVGLNRLCETTGKELLIFQILWTDRIERVTHKNISEIGVKEILMRRWDPNVERMM